MSEKNLIKQPPDLPRKFRMYPTQAIGLLLIAILPILALMGIFEPKQSTTSGRSTSLAVDLQFPKRVPYSTNSTMRVKVTNTSSIVLDSVDVEIDTSYLAAYDQVALSPQADRSFGVVLNSLQPGEKREVRIDMMGKEVGTHEGVIFVRTAKEQIRLPLSTTVFW
jgi:hypothetical protein